MLNTLGSVFNIAILVPITNILVTIYHFLYLIHIPSALGFAIILLTVLIRVVLYPFVSAQIKSTAKMQKVAPHIASIKEKHKKDARKQQEETMKLYKEHGINPAGGCLPSLVQVPIIWGLYRVLETVVVANSLASIQKINNGLYSFLSFAHIDHVWDVNFFGLPLSASPSKLFTVMPLILLVPVITAVFQFILSKMMLPESTPGKAANKNAADFQTTFQSQSLFIFPIMIGFFSFSFPVGLSLYWNTFTIFGILQQYLLVGAGGLTPWIKKIKSNG